MAYVASKQNERAENLIRRFKRACEKDGVLTRLKKISRHVKPSKIRAQKKAAAVKRYAKKVMKETPLPSRGVRGKNKSRRRK